MKKIIPTKLPISRQTLRALETAELRQAVGADGVVTNPELESIVYWCPTNTSIQRSCNAC